MNKILSLFLAVCLLAIPCLGAEKMAVVLTPGWPNEAADRIVAEIVNWLLQRSKPGDALLVFDADELKVLSEITVPGGTPRTRATALAGSMESIRAVLGRRPPTPGTPESAQARISSAVDELAQRLGGKEPWSMVLAANPLFHSKFPAEQAYSMAGYLTPNDAQITCSRTEGLFGTRERKDILKGCVVYWITPSNDWMVSTDHERNHVMRFWRLWFLELGAGLWGFSSDAHELFDHAHQRSPATTVSMPPLDRKLTRLGMVGPMVIVPGAIDAVTNILQNPHGGRPGLPIETPRNLHGLDSGATNSPSGDVKKSTSEEQPDPARHFESRGTNTMGETSSPVPLPERGGTNSIRNQPVVEPLHPPITSVVTTIVLQEPGPQSARILPTIRAANPDRLVVTVIWNGGEQQELDIWWRCDEKQPTMNPSASISARVQDPLPAIAGALRSQGLLMSEMAEVDCRRGVPKQLWIALTSNPGHEAVPCAVFLWFKDRFALHCLKFEGATTKGAQPPTGLAGAHPAWLQVPLTELFG